MPWEAVREPASGEVVRDEDRVREGLYGPLTHSGNVSVVQCRNERYREWGNWEWVGGWPMIPDCAGRRTYAEFQKGLVLRQGDSFSFRVELGAFGTTVRV